MDIRIIVVLYLCCGQHKNFGRTGYLTGSIRWNRYEFDVFQLFAYISFINLYLF